MDSHLRDLPEHMSVRNPQTQTAEPGGARANGGAQPSTRRGDEGDPEQDEHGLLPTPTVRFVSVNSFGFGSSELSRPNSEELET